ncbi:MAG: 3-dehydroquinate synthase [Phycisphaerae bacterium]|nr:3-dehydroquinate synthase [Phycisphaerae bacterium]
MSQEIRVDFAHRVVFTRGLFDPANRVLVDSLRGGAPRAVAFLDSGLAAARPDLESKLRSSLDGRDGRPSLLEVSIVPGGEVCKSDREVVDAVVTSVDRHHLCRRSWVIAIGGGAVLDAVGYGASIAHRGVRLVRIPTTVLAQDDAAMGVKNGINRFGKKNFEGVFAVPWAVLVDSDLLATLSDRHWRSGFSEAVKISLLRDEAFFRQIELDADDLRQRRLERAIPVIRRCAELHLDHIANGGDPFESREARPLDFGHWSAHKLEQLTSFELCHGEAVSIGIALDTQYSVELGWLPQQESDRVANCLLRLGLPICHPSLSDPRLLEGIEEFREHLGGKLTVTMLRSIGAPQDVNELRSDLISRAIASISSRSTEFSKT